MRNCHIYPRVSSVPDALLCRQLKIDDPQAKSFDALSCDEKTAVTKTFTSPVSTLDCCWSPQPDTPAKRSKKTVMGAGADPLLVV